jgi:hypothetical protein
MALPNYVLIGAAKAASSSIRALLRQHPDVFLAENGRELQYFARDELFERGLRWYESFFAAANGKRAIGECSNVYSMRDVYPQSVERMFATVPEAKLIYSVRDPLARIASFWTQMRGHGGEQVHHDFSTSIRVNRDWLVDPSNYGKELAAYRERFREDQILVVFFEEFRADPLAVMNRCFEFLGLDPSPPLDMGLSHENPSVGKKQAPPWLSKLRQKPAYKFARSLMPQRIRHHLRRELLFTEVTKPEWSDADKSWVLEQIGDDSRRFLAEFGKPANFWNLE